MSRQPAVEHWERRGLDQHGEVITRLCQCFCLSQYLCGPCFSDRFALHACPGTLVGDCLKKCPVPELAQEGRVGATSGGRLAEGVGIQCQVLLSSPNYEPLQFLYEPQVI